MKTLFCLTLIIVSTFTFPHSAFAADERVCREGIYVIFGNGVWNDKEAADSSRRLLNRRLESITTGTDLEGLITYATAHNPSEGKLLDLLETFEQNAQTNYSQFWRYLAGLDLLPDFLQNKLIEISKEVNASIVSSNPAVQDHVEKYNVFLSEGNKVVLVAHSQGNLFANIAYLGINSLYIDGFGIVSVGNPDNYVAGGGSYTTLEEDIIIGSVPDSLSANLDNFLGINLRDLSGHAFADSYMASGYQAENKILRDTVNTIENLTFPDTVLGSGIITATLTWGRNMDLDLHIFEPNGTHVYYANLQGIAGYLDRDGIGGYGPEHYYVSCDTIETGAYSFGINYYYGYSAETGTLTLKAGDQILSRQQTFSHPLGSSGNSNPYIMYELEVTGTPQEGYEFILQ
ncbi:MAG: hypothetical protein P8Z78_01665 [Gammaproteobacteria bacterium]|jgi:hypothetical protein